jgi:hypothetical protein
MPCIAGLRRRFCHGLALAAALLVAILALGPAAVAEAPSCGPAAAQSTMAGEAAGSPAWRDALALVELAAGGKDGRQYADQCGGTNFACHEPTPACWFNPGMQRYFCCPRGSTGCAHPQHSWCCAPGSACSAVQIGGCRRL